MFHSAAGYSFLRGGSRFFYGIVSSESWRSFFYRKEREGAKAACEVEMLFIAEACLRHFAEEQSRDVHSGELTFRGVVSAYGRASSLRTQGVSDPTSRISHP